MLSRLSKVSYSNSNNSPVQKKSSHVIQQSPYITRLLQNKKSTSEVRLPKSQDTETIRDCSRMNDDEGISIDTKYSLLKLNSVKAYV